MTTLTLLNPLISVLAETIRSIAQRQTASLGNVFAKLVLAWDWGWRGEGLRGAAQAGCRQPLTLSRAEGSPILGFFLLPLLSCSLNFGGWGAGFVDR